MYCKHCGKPLPEGAAFCPNCGQKVTASASEPGPAPGADSQSAEDRYNNSYDRDKEARIIGDNAAYYQAQFQKIRAGEAGTFNWAAFFLSVFHAAYRGPWREWWKFIRIPFLGSWIFMILKLVGMGTGLPALSIISSALASVFSILCIIRAIQYGFAFNKLYLGYVEEQKRSPQPKQGPSGQRLAAAILIMLALNIAYGVASMLVSINMVGDIFDNIQDFIEEKLEESEIADTESDTAEEPGESEDLEDSEESEEPSENSFMSVFDPSESSDTESEALMDSVEVVRYATHNGRDADCLPQEDTIAEDIADYGCSGFVIIEPIEDDVENTDYGTHWVRLDVIIYDEDWDYLTDLNMVYSCSGTADGDVTPYTLDESRGGITELDNDPEDYGLYYTREDYEQFNELDEKYFGDAPTPGYPWNDPETDEWTIDGEPYIGGLYGQ